MLLIFHNLPSSGFSKILVFFIMDNEHTKFFAFFVTNVTTWNFSFLLWFYRHGVTWMFEKLCIALIPPAAWMSGCFFISCPAAWSYTIWPAQQPFKANQELSAALINTAAPPLPKTAEFVSSPNYTFLLFLSFSRVLVETSWSFIHFIFLFYSQLPNCVLF